MFCMLQQVLLYPIKIHNLNYGASGVQHFLVLYLVTQKILIICKDANIKKMLVHLHMIINFNWKTFPFSKLKTKLIYIHFHLIFNASSTGKSLFCLILHKIGFWNSLTARWHALNNTKEVNIQYKIPPYYPVKTLSLSLKWHNNSNIDHIVLYTHKALIKETSQHKQDQVQLICMV